MAQTILKALATHQYFQNSQNVPVIWGRFIGDNLGFWNQANPTQLIVPDGVNKIRLTASCVWEQNPNGMRQFVLKKNGAFADGLPVTNVPANSITTTDFQLISPVLNVQPGDVFTVDGYQNSGITLPLYSSTGTWVSVEIV